jgi:subtilisin family serine protease
MALERGKFMPNTPDKKWIPVPDEAQATAYARRTRDQVSKLGASGAAVSGTRRVNQLLWTRHQAKGALGIDVVEGGQALVVSRELLFPAGPGRDDAVAALSSRDSTTFKWVKRAPRCEALQNRVWVYELKGGTDEKAATEVTRALNSLRANNVDSGAAFHGLGLHQMVHKSTDGPAPIQATVATFTSSDVKRTQLRRQIKVAVIDTGIAAYNKRRDGWLNEVVRDNTGGNNGNIDKLDVFDTRGSRGMPILDLAAGHGTFAAGIIRQVDPEANIVVYRALDPDGVGREEDVACAMIRAAEEGAHVINLSLGVEAVDGVVPPLLQAAVDHIRRRRNPPAIVAAAGNSSNQKPIYPAALDWVVAVAALRAVDPASGQSPGGATWSSRGAWVTCSAVGEGIVSTFVKGEEDQAKQLGTDVYPQHGWALWSGTSFAAPQVAALIARKCREGMSPQAAVDALFPTTNRPVDGYGTRVIQLRGTRPGP